MDFVAVLLILILVLMLTVSALVLAYMLTHKDPRTGATAPIILKMRKYVLLSLGVSSLLVIGFDLYRTYGSVSYFTEIAVMLVIGLLMGAYWLRRTAGTFDIRKLHFDTDESFILPYSFERTCKAIPAVVASNRWKLVEANEQLGHFQVKIGVSIKTWGEVMLIDISQVDTDSSKVSVRCSAQHQLYDYGKSYSDITKLHTKLLQELGSSK